MSKQIIYHGSYSSMYYENPEYIYECYIQGNIL